jgi:predicted DNA-binding transcriptional regulator YafY
VRRADRLFQIVQHLRRRRVTTATRLAEALGVSLRTIYRDIRDLTLSGVPVQGEAGVGYALPRGFDIPPLMFTQDEIEALVLGARIVQSWGDPGLARAADAALAKVENVLPARLKDRVPDAALFAPDFHIRSELRAALGPLREAIRDRRKVRFRYRDRGGAATERTVRPLGLFYWGSAWSLGAWCETRRDFRNFRLDRLTELSTLTETFTPAPGQTPADFFRRYEDDTPRT